MDSLERYGTSLVKYEGVADLTFPDDSGVTYKGYFEAKQLTGGGIAIAFVPIVHDAGGSETVTARFFSEPSFHGRDKDGWELTTCGQTLALPILGPLDAPKSAVHPASVFGSQCIRAQREGAMESGYTQAHFLVSNLLWHGREVAPEPITLEAGGMNVTVAPVGGYMEVAESIVAVRGIAPTAEVSIKTSDGSNLSLERYADFMNDLVSVFRLVTGNRVDWFYGEAFEVGADRVVERFHKDAVTGPFSKTIRFRRPPRGMVRAIDFQALVSCFLDDGDKALDRKTLKEMINYFINACDETSYLEARGLLASTLLDLIVFKYASGKNAHNVMEEQAFKGQILPTLRKAIRTVRLPELTNELRKRAIEQLRGAYRRSFRKRLEFLTKQLNLPLGDEVCGRAVKIRNKLVHEGTYLTENEGDVWYRQYKLMIWVDLVALCRLAGYEDDLPSLTDRLTLEV